MSRDLKEVRKRLLEEERSVGGARTKALRFPEGLLVCLINSKEASVARAEGPMES